MQHLLRCKLQEKLPCVTWPLVNVLYNPTSDMSPGDVVTATPNRSFLFNNLSFSSSCEKYKNTEKTEQSLENQVEQSIQNVECIAFLFRNKKCLDDMIMMMIIYFEKRKNNNVS